MNDMLFIAIGGALFLAFAFAVVFALMSAPSVEKRPIPIRTAKVAVVGIALPVFCEAVNLALFLGRFPAGGVSDGWFCAFHSFMALEMFLLATWLLLGDRLGKAEGFFAGAFRAGAGFAVILGIALLPFSIPGALMGIGLLGFCPFLSAWAFHAASKAAWQHSKMDLQDRFASFARAAGVLLVIALPITFQASVQLAERRGFFGSGGADVAINRAVNALYPGAGKFLHIRR